MSPSLTYAQQQQLIKKYLAAAVKSHETAAGLVMSKTALRLKQVTAQELKRFKKGPESRGNFHKAVKQYDFPKAKGAAGPASYVRLGVPWIHIFEEGGTVTGGSGWSVILMPDGEKLGYKRGGKGSLDRESIKQLVERKKATIIPADDGFFVALKRGQGLLPVLIYKVQKNPVRVPKKLNFYDNAERLADKMPDEINKLIK